MVPTVHVAVWRSTYTNLRRGCVIASSHLKAKREVRR